MNEGIERRLRGLERRSRVLTAALAALLALAALTAGRAVTAAEVVSAERFELVDGEGRVRAELTIDADGAAGLFVFDADGRTRVSVAHDDAQSALFVRDEEGQIRLGSALFAHGGAGYALHREGGAGSSVLYHKGGKGSLRFFDTEGAVVHRVPE